VRRGSVKLPQPHVVVRFAGNADVPVRSQRKSHSDADEDVRVPALAPLVSRRTTTNLSHSTAKNGESSETYPDISSNHRSG